jgi:hypothetical protein
MSKIISVVWKTSAALSLTTLFLIGCSSSTKNHQTNAATDVLAVVNDTTISRKEFEDQMRYLAQYRSSRLFTDEQKKNLLVDMVNFELILQRAVKENFPSEDEGIRRAIVQEYLKQRVNGQVAPSEDEILAAYKKSQLEYSTVFIYNISPSLTLIYRSSSLIVKISCSHLSTTIRRAGKCSFISTFSMT